jgi:hypothetical protein
LESGHDTVTVTVHLSTPITDNRRTWYKYDSVAGWRTYDHAVFSSDGKTVSLLLKDGDPLMGDVDGVANGIIIDPGGVGLSDGSTNPDPNGGDGESGIDDNGLCFISTTVPPTGYGRFERYVFMLVGFVLFSAVCLRKKEK